MTPQEAIHAANGRSIIVGEDHYDRRCLGAQLALINAAHRAGYRALGVEVAKRSFHQIRGRKYPGLDDIVLFISRMQGNIPQKLPGGEKTENLYWLVRYALWYEWDVVPIDPRHWYGHTKALGFGIRDPGTADAIVRARPMIVNSGAAHLKGLHGRLGSRALFVTTYLPSAADWAIARAFRPHLLFLKNLPFLGEGSPVISG